MTTKALGQYFTVSEQLQEFVFNKVKYRGRLLEPSFGAGHLLKKFLALDPQYPMTCYEIDKTIKPIVEFNGQLVTYADFTKQLIGQTFDTIIGNPPYIKQKTGNLYIKFIDLCFNLLSSKGEMIFIVPSDFIKLTSAATLITKMTADGSFTDFLFPNNENLFEGASIDVLVFRYEKGLHTNQLEVNGVKKFCNVTNGIMTFRDTVVTGVPLSEKFHVYVGLVSGRDEIYHSPLGNLDLLCNKDTVKKFILTEAFPSGNAAIDAHLLANKSALLERKIRKFGETNWFEWGAPRNKASMTAHFGKPCIYVRNVTRKSEVAFLGQVQYFGGSLLCLVPKTEMTAGEIENVVGFLNRTDIQKDYVYSGRFKIGHKQVCNILL